MQPQKKADADTRFGAMGGSRVETLHQAAFGKLQRDDAGAIKAWHPLVDHLADVAACFERLCRCRAVRRSLEVTAGRKLQSSDIARLAALVFLHDLGKANSGFQAKRWPKDHRPREWPLPAGHGLEATRIFGDDAFGSLAEKLPIQSLCAWGDSVDALLTASISHHGRPVIEDSGDWNRAIWGPVIGSDGLPVYDPAAVLQEIGERVTALYPKAFKPGREPLPHTPALGHLFAGLVQLADWLGSDTRFFAYSKAQEDRSTTAPHHADRAIEVLGLDPERWRAELNATPPTFAQVFDVVSPYPIQEAMDDPELGPLASISTVRGSANNHVARRSGG
jgi:CRISPR-associated endonuclease/helicase Cas3